MPLNVLEDPRTSLVYQAAGADRLHLTRPRSALPTTEAHRPTVIEDVSSAAARAARRPASRA